MPSMLLRPPSYGYEATYRIMAHEIDPQKRITAHALLQLMQEASLQNAILLKVSLWDLADKYLSWVLLRKYLQVKRWPELGETIRIMTYPSGFDRIFAYRDFIAYDEKDNLIATASSTWTLMDLQTRRAVRIPDFMMKLVPEAPDDILPRPLSRLPKVAEWRLSYDDTVRYFDLDWNDHVNNLTLVKYMLQGISKELWETQVMRSLTYHIKSECLLEDNISIEVSDEEKRSSSIIKHHERGGIAASLIEWE